MTETSNSALRVYVAVGGLPIYRRGLAALLAADPTVECVGSAEDATAALHAAPALAPDAVIVDPGLNDAAGAPLMTALHERLPQTRFIAFTDLPCRPAAGGTLAACLAAVLRHNASLVELTLALRSVRLGVALSAPAERASGTAGTEVADFGADLTPRERVVLGLMAQGLSNHDISARLDIALPTVKFHITNILSKLGVLNRTAAVLAALRHEIVSLA